MLYLHLNSLLCNASKLGRRLANLLVLTITLTIHLHAQEMVSLTLEDKIERMKQQSNVMQSFVLRDLLDAAGYPTAFYGDSIGYDFRKRDGSYHQTGLLGAKTLAYGLVEAHERWDTSENLWNVYSQLYPFIPENQRSSFHNPITGRVIDKEFLKELLYRADITLGTVWDIDRNRKASVSLQQALFPQTFGMGLLGCMAPTGLFSKVDFPLKTFVTGPRDQGRRGFCHTFVAIKALESRRMVVNDAVDPDFSEQQAANVALGLAGPDYRLYGDASTVERVIWRLYQNDILIGPETSWPYNPSWDRPSNAFSPGIDGTAASYKDACKNYAFGADTGLCDENAFQGPMRCTMVDPLSTSMRCGYIRATTPVGGWSGLEVRFEESYNVVWEKLSTDPLPTNNLRMLMRAGIPIMASFQIREDFDKAYLDGIVKYTTTSGLRGGHAALLFGFVSNSELSTVSPMMPRATGEGYFIGVNSWGCGWGDNGYFYIDEEYLKQFGIVMSTLDIPSTRGMRWSSMP